MSQPSLVFLSKTGHAICDQATAFVRQHWPTATICRDQRDDSAFPEILLFTKQDYLISFLSPWIVPKAVLDNTTKQALNFHPGSPDYPGTGCVNFALYEQAPEFGATCHVMEPAVDTGAIVQVERFPVYPRDTVESLLVRTHHATLALFYWAMDALLQGRTLVPSTTWQWTRKPFTRAALDALSVITHDMDEAEVQRRVRATQYGRWQPSIKVGGTRFVAAPPQS